MRYFILVFLLSVTNIALASQSSNTEMLVSATVSKFCTASSTPLSFGNYNYGALGASITLTVTCTIGTKYYIGVRQPNGARKMLNNKNESLIYTISQNFGGSKPLGNIIEQDTISGTGTGFPTTITIYAIIKEGQDVSPGDYKDKFDIILSF
jgi:spore coat protein U-like protein